MWWKTLRLTPQPLKTSQVLQEALQTLTDGQPHCLCKFSPKARDGWGHGNVLSSWHGQRCLPCRRLPQLPTDLNARQAATTSVTQKDARHKAKQPTTKSSKPPTTVPLFNYTWVLPVKSNEDLLQTFCNIAVISVRPPIVEANSPWTASHARWTQSTFAWMGSNTKYVCAWSFWLHFGFTSIGQA